MNEWKKCVMLTYKGIVIQAVGFLSILQLLMDDICYGCGEGQINFKEKSS